MTDALRQSFQSDGHAVLREAATADMARNLLSVIHGSMIRDPKGLKKFELTEPRVNEKAGYEFYGPRLPSVMTFHWGLTSHIAEIVGRRIVPSFSFVRVYMAGDRLLVHSDRKSCEYALSLSLGYSDDIIWPLELGQKHYDFADIADRPKEETFGSDAYQTVMLAPGDALLYRGVNLRHGRMQPSPNRWSAHLFLFWVEADGEFKDLAFDRMTFNTAIEFPPPGRS
ncbi:MAG: hypothetical protein ACKVS5_11295 [Parvularculaceae bacterium]